MELIHITLLNVCNPNVELNVFIKAVKLYLINYHGVSQCIVDNVTFVQNTIKLKLKRNLPFYSLFF